MKSKKVIALLLATVLTTSALLAGCGKTADSGAATEGATATGETPAGNTAADVPDSEVMNAEGLPIADPANGVSFTLFTDSSGTNESLYMMPVLEEQTGVKVDLQAFPYEIATEKFSLALSSGDYADCIGGWVLSQNDILTYGVDMGVFVPLEGYFEKYCPKIMELLELPGVRETMTAPDGHIYSIPYVLDAPEVDFNPYINRVWLDNLGLEMPTTTEELKEVLMAFKTQDANGNGDPNDEIPFSADPNNRKIGKMFGYFGESVDYYGLTMHGDELAFAGTSDAFKEGVKYFADLYANGLIDNEIFTQDLATWKAKGAQGLYGVSIAYGSGDYLPMPERGAEPDYSPLPVLTSSMTDKPVWLANTNGTDVLKNQVVITDKAANPEVICRWFDNLFSLENSVQVNSGPIDKVLFEDGKTADGHTAYRKIDTLTLPQEEQDMYSWANLFPQSLPRYLPADYKLNEEFPPWPEKDITDDLYRPYLTAPIPKYWIGAEDAAELSDLDTALKSYMDQKLAEWISGQSDVEKEWEEYKEYLNTLGIERYVELRKAALQQQGE